MTPSGELAAVREDAAQLAREGQTSFEGFPSEIPWRSVSECEGIAAIALLACGQQGSANRSSSGRGGDSSGANIRCDSSAWPYLIASGGEIAPPSGGGIDRSKSASSGDEAQGTTTNSNNSGESSNNDGSSSNGGAGESATKKPLELGPMPTAPPFGGYKQNLANSSSSKRSGSRSGSRSGGSSRRSKGERRKAASGSRNQNSPTAGSMSLGASSSIFNFFNDASFSSSRSISGGSPGDPSSTAVAAAAAAAASGGDCSGGGDIGGIRGGLGEVPSSHPRRQESFDPDRDIEIEHKEIGVVPHYWATARPPDIHGRGLVATATPLSHRKEGGRYAAGACVPRPTTVSGRNWDVAYPSNRDGVDGGGGGGGEDVRYPTGRYVVPPPPSSSPSSLQSQPSWVQQRGVSLGSGPALVAQPAGINDELGDGRQHSPCWMPASAPTMPSPIAPSTVRVVEPPFKHQPPRSYVSHPGGAQVPAHLYPQHHPLPHPSQRSRREGLERPADRGQYVKEDIAASAAATAAAAASAAAASAAAASAAAATTTPARTPPSSPPTAPPPPPSPTPTPSPPRSAATAAVASRVQQHSPTRKLAVGSSPPNNGSYNLLAMMIPDLAKMGGRSPGGAGATAQAPGSGLSGTPQHPAASCAFADTSSSSSASRSHAFNLDVPHSESTFPPSGLAATMGGCYPGVGRGGVDGSLDEEEARKAQKKIAIARYRRKRLRRPYVKAERDQDPNRMIQNQSRVRPRRRGKFCKKGPDYIAITRVQASSNRSISGEMPIRDPPAPLRGDQGVRGVGGRGGVGGGIGSRVSMGGVMSVVAWPPLGGGIKQQ